MGNSKSSSGLQGVTKRAESRVGKITITGRYHRSPKKLDDDYILETKVLGSGYSGQVYLARSRLTNDMFAVKGFKLHGIRREKRAELESEAEIFLGMDHPHVARLVDVYESEDQLRLVMECMTGGELFQRVTERKRFSEKDAANAVYQILLAVNYLHRHGVVHRDIKLENFLYEAKDSDHLKLIDFGFSKIWTPNTKMALSCGTLAYVAPEVLNKNYTSQCDIWGVGVVTFILLFGYMPFSGSESQQVRLIKAGKYMVKKDPWARVSDEARDFVRKLLVVDPNVRLTAEQALEHPWMQKKDWQNVTVDQETVMALCNFAQASVFRRACMSMMAWSLTNEERAKVRGAFLAMDTNHSGTILIGEFKRILETQFHITDEEAERAFKALDQNHSDEIHYSEFLAAMVSSRIALHDDLLRVAFRRFDTDSSGFITPANLREVLGETYEGEEVEKLMQEADLARDGQISLEEWMEYLRGDASDGAAKGPEDVAARVIDVTILRQPAVRPVRIHSRSGPTLHAQIVSSRCWGSTKEKGASQDAGAACKASCKASCLDPREKPGALARAPPPVQGQCACCMQ